jgi:hypothetical protein
LTPEAHLHSLKFQLVGMAEPNNILSASRHIQKICCLSENLPAAVPIADPTDKIFTVFSRDEEETQWQTFNSRFDAVFGDDCRDPKTKKLHFIRRGPHGMGHVCEYLKTIHLEDPDLPLDLVIGKLSRLNNELFGLA